MSCTVRAQFKFCWSAFNRGLFLILLRILIALLSYSLHRGGGVAGGLAATAFTIRVSQMTNRLAEKISRKAKRKIKTKGSQHAQPQEAAAATRKNKTHSFGAKKSHGQPYKGIPLKIMQSSQKMKQNRFMAKLTY